MEIMRRKVKEREEKAQCRERGEYGVQRGEKEKK